MIKPHKTWNILDSSKLKCYMTCPRKFMYKYILGWAPEGTSVHLVFGEGWHRAMEYLLKHGLNKENIEPAWEKLKEYYDRHFDEHEYSVYAPKEPNRAIKVLTEYVVKYRNTDNFDVEHTEVAGTVPITADQVLHFRLDAIVKEDGLYLLVDHKTSGRGGSTWIQQWRNSFQIALYLHVMFSLYGANKVKGALINGAIIRKNNSEFIRVPVRKSPDIMDAWLSGAQYWARIVRMQTESFREDLKSGKLMEDNTVRQFPQNPTNCTKYGACPFLDYCVSWSNPIRKTDGEPPLGFKREWWNPAEIESNQEVEL